MVPVCIAYYCSGHGYGHATRVSAFASHLLSLSDAERPVVIYIVSSSPQHVFAPSIENGAHYRFADIDPVIVQPLAYCVDREKSVQVLEAFLQKKDALLEVEQQWLFHIRANVVISDAAFLGCQAAKLVGIPSILITNFTFDSVYSYLSTPFRDVQTPDENKLIPMNNTLNGSLDALVPLSILEPLVDQIHFGYQCADLLLRLPGHIPIPSFTAFPSLPSSDWVDVETNKFLPDILEHLLQPAETYHLHPEIPFPEHTNLHRKVVSRTIITAPLFVRPPSSLNVYTLEGRSRLLASLNIPEHLRDPEQTKILVVSFGGQFIRGPSRPGSRSQSGSATPTGTRRTPPPIDPQKTGFAPNGQAEGSLGRVINEQCTFERSHVGSAHRRTTPSHIWVSGAPPALNVIPASPLPQACSQLQSPIEDVPQSLSTTDLLSNGVTFATEPERALLPNLSWIAIICGVSKEQWTSQLEPDALDLPDRFFVAPKDVYMPDLSAVGDVLLGKLGYGTVSECVDACTPFVYVSRPLFIEEHGLRFLLEKEGVGVELSRAAYEGGYWADAIQKAWELGKDKKAKKREEALLGVSGSRQQEIRDLARMVLRWTEEVEKL